MALICAALCPSDAEAQPQTAASSKADAASPSDRAAAGTKFRAAEASFTRKDFARAATEFEESYAIVPHPNTMLNAAKAWGNGGNALAAAKACLRLQEDFPSAPDAGLARDRLRTLLPQLAVLRVKLEVGGADLRIDAEESSPGMVVLEPGEHVVAARFGDSVVERRVTLRPGADVELLVTAAGPEPASQNADSPGWPTPLPIYVFSAAVSLTVASGVVLLWSGLDTQSRREAFDDAPTGEHLLDGRSAQARTNVLIGTTAGLGVATAVLGFFTDWRGEPAPVSFAFDGEAGFTQLRLEL